MAPKTKTPKADAASSSSRVSVSSVSDNFVALVKADVVTRPDSMFTNKEIKAICESFIKVLVSQVKEGKTVSFKNHMSFKRVERGERTHKNPKTNEDIVKPAHYVMTMTVMPALKDQFEELPVMSATGGDAVAADEE